MARFADALDGQVESFQTAASQAFAPLKIAPAGRGDFRNSFRSAAAGDVRVTRITGAPCTVLRTPALIGSSDPELVKVALHATGTARVEQDGRQSLLHPGDLVNYVTSRPYKLTFTEPYEAVVIGVPVRRLGLHARDLDRQTAVAVPSGGAVRARRWRPSSVRSASRWTPARTSSPATPAGTSPTRWCRW
ncbi:cupin domain-containing protein [Fodinicola feengrottensis]|uniref:cupin domain-containing protein n=1 Tax=Fodinicola feengrottensis TaxID=435914 RepID=UPI0013D249FA|nr:hypothetical protein [Fodinicola feengrottensis]